MTRKRRIGKIAAWTIAGIILAAMLAVVIFLAVCGFRGSTEVAPFLDENGKVLPGSIAERVYLDVNGQKNGMILRGKSVDQPVLLFISGGPGVPEYWMNEVYKEKYPNRLEEHFTVCWWDYAGEGLSYDSSLDPKEITLDRLTKDALEVVRYLKERFGVPKVYLMAHSAGTGLGMHLVQENSEEFYCYFSMGQSVDGGYGNYDSAYRFMKEIFEENGQEEEIEKMEALLTERDGYKVLKEGYTGGDWEKFLLKAGCATTREMRSDALEIFFPQMLSSCYTLTEKINYWRGKMFMSKTPFNNEKRVQMNEELKPVEIPVCFLMGKYDYTTPISMVRELYEKLPAKDKAFYEFEDSAHSPLWEENDKVLEVMEKYVQ